MSTNLTVKFFTIFIGSLFFNKFVGAKQLRQIDESKATSLSYKSLKDRTLKKILIQKDDELGKGGFGKVFVAFVKNGEALGIPENRCLAVKEIELDGRGNISSKGFRNSAKVLNKIEKLDDAKKKHLLKIYDFGIIIGSPKRRPKRALIIMEKGSDGFDHRLYNSDNLPGIEAMIRQIVEPIKEMHQVGMHLDVKPQNFLFVPSGGTETEEDEEEGEGELLKLIDFDGAEQFPEKVGWLLWRRRLERRKRADYRKIPKMRLASPMYSSPESYRMLHGTSSKADIWSLGIMIYEILLVKSERKAQQLNESTENFRLNITLKLLQTLAIYSGRSINLNAKLLIPKKFVYNLSWLNSSAEAIKRIFKFWIKSTRLAVLLTNLLHIVPQKRMTAEGVLDYLDLKCYPAEMSWSYAWTGIIFNKITFKKLAEMIIERKRLCAHENCTQKWEQMHKMMDKVRKKRQAIVNESQQMSESIKHCATTYQNSAQNTE